MKYNYAAEALITKWKDAIIPEIEISRSSTVEAGTGETKKKAKKKNGSKRFGKGWNKARTSIRKLSLAANVIGSLANEVEAKKQDKPPPSPSGAAVTALQQSCGSNAAVHGGGTVVVLW